jgi:hypothetical protein
MPELLPSEVKVYHMTRVGTGARSDAMMGMLRGAYIGTGMMTCNPKRTVRLYTIQTDADGDLIGNRRLKFSAIYRHQRQD